MTRFLILKILRLLLLYLLDQKFFQRLVFICRTKEEWRDKDYNETALSVSSRSRCNRNNQKLMIIMVIDVKILMS